MPSSSPQFSTTGTPGPSREYTAAMARLNDTDALLPPDAPITAERAHYDGRLPDLELQDDLHLGKPMRIAGRLAEMITPAGHDPLRAIFWLHPGGFCFGSLRSHRGLAGALARASGCRVLALDYRLAPEHPFPAANEDSVAAFQWLMDTGTPPGGIALVGASAGAAVAAGTAMLLRARSRTMADAAQAGALGLMTPWLDLTLPERLTDAPAISSMARRWLGPDRPSNHPIASPFHGDWRGLPPVLLQAAGDDIFAGDATSLAKRFAEHPEAAPVAVESELADGMCHLYPALGEHVPEAIGAVRRLADFILRHTSQPEA